MSKCTVFLLFFSFYLFIIHVSSMRPNKKDTDKLSMRIDFKPDQNTTDKKILEEIEKLKDELKQMKIGPQKNFKKICFGYVDDKVYNFPEGPFTTIECTIYLRKIINFLKKTDGPLFQSLYNLCLCNSFQEKIHLQLKNSKNKGIKALKEIHYKGTFILSKEGSLSKDGKDLILKVIEMFWDIK